MEVVLNRVDYMQIALTSRKCLAVLPQIEANDKHTQKVVVGDHDGVLQAFQVKKGEINVVFRTLPGTKINGVKLGGTIDSPQDKIFACSGNFVKGFTRKGKQFLGFGTNLAEEIQHMFVHGTDLIVCSSFVFNHYRDCVEVGYYLSSDEIKDVICLPPNKITGLTAILACGDRCLRVVRSKKLAYEVHLESVPTCLELADGDGGVSGDCAIFGTADGHVGMVKFGSTSATIEWIMTEDYSTGIVRPGGVSCMAHFDVTGDGYRDLIIGREDGTIDLYSYQDAETLVHKFNYTGSESITGVAAGIVGREGYPEIVAVTYSGMVFGLTTCSAHVSLGSAAYGSGLNVRVHEKLDTLKSEVDELQNMVAVERDAYHARTLNSSAGVSAVPSFSLRHQMVLNREEASYTLSLEVQAPIDIVLLQSDVPVDLLDLEKNSAVVSLCNPDPLNDDAETAKASGLKNHLLATYRCQANTTRLEVKVRTIEGQYGTLQAYIIPRIQPKGCVVKQFPIKPLSLHTRTRTFDENRPLNCLHLKGNFSFAEMHAWVYGCLPEIPERVPGGDDATWVFRSTFLDTLLECKYGKGDAVFRSDNISTISIVKEFVTKEATKNKIHLDMTCDVSKESVVHTLGLISPKLEAHLKLAKQVQLIDGLREIQLHEGDVSFLAPEYQDILRNADQLRAEFNRQPCYLDRLYGMITDLYIDRYKFLGFNVKARVPLLLDLLDNNYDREKLAEFFEEELN